MFLKGIWYSVAAIKAQYLHGFCHDRRVFMPRQVNPIHVQVILIAQIFSWWPKLETQNSSQKGPLWMWPPQTIKYEMLRTAKVLLFSRIHLLCNICCHLMASRKQQNPDGGFTRVLSSAPKATGGTSDGAGYPADKTPVPFLAYMRFNQSDISVKPQKEKVTSGGWHINTSTHNHENSFLDAVAELSTASASTAETPNPSLNMDTLWLVYAKSRNFKISKIASSQPTCVKMNLLARKGTARGLGAFCSQW